MPASRNIHDFYELRAGLEGMRDFVEAALGFMDDTGIALSVRRPRLTRVATNGNGNGAGKNLDAIREQVKRHYTSKRGTAKKGRPSTKAMEPDGKHATIAEVAKMLKVSDGHVRNMTTDGRLPKPTYEQRVTKKGRPYKAQVLPLEAIDIYKKTLAAAEA